MKLSQGVEWTLHTTVLLSQLPPGTVLPRRTLADHYGLPDAYLAKHLQLLVRAGVLLATPGPRGGFALARPPERITVLDVVEAVEGGGSPFLCQEIRQRGSGAVPPDQCTRPCGISGIMAGAHEAWRRQLRAVTLRDVADGVPDSVRNRNLARYAPTAPPVSANPDG